jgi:excisionase family DNA binding protein
MRTADKYKNFTSEEQLSAVLRPKEVASYLGINVTAGYEIFKRSDIGSFKIGKKWLITKKEFLRWLKDQGEKTKDN